MRQVVVFESRATVLNIKSDGVAIELTKADGSVATMWLNWSEAELIAQGLKEAVQLYKDRKPRRDPFDDCLGYEDPVRD